MSLIGNISEYNPAQEEWEIYREKLEEYFYANKISEDRTQVATLLSLVGSNTYKLLRNLCHPSLPNQKTFKQLCELMNTQFTPLVTVWRERIKFYQAQQYENENIADWYARIKNLAVNCDFGNQLTNILRDKFMCGMREGKIQDRLCEEKGDKKFDELLQLALQKECIVTEKKENDVNWVKFDNRNRGTMQKDGYRGVNGRQ